MSKSLRDASLARFLAAQRAVAIAESTSVDGDWEEQVAAGEATRQAAFRASALAAADALDFGITLQQIAHANAASCAELPPELPKGTLYISVEAVAYHALTGQLLRLPVQLGRGPVIPTKAQALLVKVKRDKGTRAVKDVLHHSKSQNEAMDRLSSITPTASSARTRSVDDIVAHLAQLIETGAQISETAARTLSAIVDDHWRNWRELRDA